MLPAPTRLLQTDVNFLRICLLGPGGSGRGGGGLLREERKVGNSKGINVMKLVNVVFVGFGGLGLRIGKRGWSLGEASR